jgi:hypothetical protein
MSAARWHQLPELFGFFSASVLLLSLTAWALGHSRPGSRWLQVSERVRVEIVRRLPWVWGILAVAMVMLAARAKAYSGPREGPRWEAHLRAGNDIDFAFAIALAFGMAFALDALRLPGLKDRLIASLALLMYTPTVVLTVGSVWQRAGP